MRVRELFLAFILFSISVAPSYASHQRSRDFEWYEEKPVKPTILVHRTIYTPPAVCQVEVFKKSCGTNQRCKEQKEACGDKFSEEFTDSLLAVQTRLGQVTIHDGKYSGNRGIDDLRSVQTAGISYVIPTENKADTARLNRKINQHSVQANRSIITKLSNSKKITSQQQDQFKEDIQAGRMIRGYSHVALKPVNHNTFMFNQSYGVVFSETPELREKEEQSYCRTLHAQLMAEAEKPGVKATLALMSLNGTCPYYASQILQQPENTNYSSIQRTNYLPLSNHRRSVVRVRPRASSYNDDEQVCYNVPYRQQRVSEFTKHLISRGHTKASIARRTLVTDAIITSIIDKPNYTPRNYNLTDIWESFQQKYQDEFNKWASRL
ncbi:hypothetical protein IM40_09430 (plasmid) [Candidatus Paracaedimonas acanthamoebae]|nr:hypothetical protein IM40_09430 [Candidatus Paracaedimonas acanthamoebae]